MKCVGEVDWDAVWRMRKSGDYFVMNKKYFDVINYTKLIDGEWPILVGSVRVDNVRNRVELFLLIYALLNLRADKHIEYYTRIYDMLNEKE